MTINPAAIEAGTQNESRDPQSSPEYALVDSLPCASLIAFTGASLDSFLYLNHGHVFAGVMSGNAILCGIGVFNKSNGGMHHYAWPIFAYVAGISLIALAQRRVHHDPARFALALVMFGLFIMSFVPATFNDEAYAFIVVLLTGFLVGISQKVDSYAYNATVLTGTLRDGTIALYNLFDPALRVESLKKVRALWTLMFSFFAGAVCGGLLGRHIGNHALWLPIVVLGVVIILVSRRGSDQTGFDHGRRSMKNKPAQ